MTEAIRTNPNSHIIVVEDDHDITTDIDSHNIRDIYNEVTTSRPWRHTIGRISCLARIPIYAIAFGLQTVKTLIKAVVSPIFSGLAWVANTKKLDSWTFSGVAKDGLIWVKLLDKIGCSALGVLCAPPKKYHSFFGGIKLTINTVILGRHQNLSVHELIYGIKNIRAVYAKIIFENETIHNNTVFTRLASKKIKAG